MNTKRIFSALALLSLFAVLFVSCSPNSLADEDSLYDTEQGQEKKKIKVPSQG